MSKQLSTLLRHGHLPGAIEFWRLKEYLQNDLERSQHWSDEKWMKQWQKAEETRKDFNIVLILQEQFFISELFKVMQDAILLILHYRTMS